jgi:hypothetical protein
LIDDGRKFMRAFAMATLAVTALLAMATEAFDPFGENDWTPLAHTRFTYRPLSAPRLYAKLDNGPHAIVFGTSRSAMMTQAAIGAPTLNFYAIYGNPRAVLTLFRHLSDHQWRNVREVFYLLDAHVFCARCWIDDVDYTDPVEIALYKAQHFPEAVLRLPMDLARVLKGDLDAYGENGALVGWNVSGYDGRWANRTGDGYYIGHYDDETLSLLIQIDELMRAHRKPIYYFSPPLPVITQAKTDLGRLAAFKKVLLQYVPEYHDLTHLDGLSDRIEFFMDETHVNMIGAEGLVCAIRSGRFLMTRDRAASIDPARGRAPNRSPLPDECIELMQRVDRVALSKRDRPSR